MILSIYSVGSLVASLFFSSPEDSSVKANSNALSAAYFSTEWEAVPEWQRSASGNEVTYHFNRNTAELESATAPAGAVVVFVKGYDFTGFSKVEKPLGLPFYFISPDENSGTYNWHTEYSKGNINVALQMQAATEENFLKASNNIRMRYFILSPQFMKQHKLNAQSLRGISYNRLTALLGIAPQA